MEKIIEEFKSRRAKRLDQRFGGDYQKVVEFRKRRAERLDAKNADEEGRWVTTENNHKVHINEEGEPDKGNPHVVAKMQDVDADVSKENLEDLAVSYYSARRMAYESKKNVTWPKEALDYALGWKERTDKWKNTRAELLKQIDEEYDGGDIDKIKERAEALDKYARTTDFKNWDELRKAEREAYKEKSKIDELKKIQERLSQLDDLIEREKDPPSEEKLKELREEYEDAVAKHEECAKKFEESCSKRRAALSKKFDKLSKCKSVEDVEDYLFAKGYFKDEYNGDMEDGTHLRGMKATVAKQVAQRIDKIMEDYPFMVGRDGGIRNKFMGKSEENTYALAHHSGFVELNCLYWENRKKFEESWEQCMQTKYHPPNTKYDSIIDHEMTHEIEYRLNDKMKENGRDERASDIVMERVARRFFNKSPDKGVVDAEESNIRYMVSQYAYKNKGVSYDADGHAVENKSYGRNTEFLAEAIAEARCSETPRKIAVMVKEELDKLVKEVFG